MTNYLLTPIITADSGPTRNPIHPASDNKQSNLRFDLCFPPSGVRACVQNVCHPGACVRAYAARHIYPLALSAALFPSPHEPRVTYTPHMYVHTHTHACERQDVHTSHVARQPGPRQEPRMCMSGDGGAPGGMELNGGSWVYGINKG